MNVWLSTACRAAPIAREQSVVGSSPTQDSSLSFEEVLE